MSRQKKWLQRETAIINATISLMETSSFMDLRMSDIARAAECSMGAIYSHFSSKEDLLLGCAFSRMKEKKRLLDNILHQDMKPIEYLLMVVFSLWVIDEQNPQLYQLTQLSMNPSVWRRASPRRSSEMNELGREMQDELARHAMETLSQLQGSPANIRDAEHFCLGLMGLGMGTYCIKESGFGCFEERLQEGDGVELHLSNLERYLLGWGLVPGSFEINLRDLRAHAERFITQESS